MNLRLSVNGAKALAKGDPWIAPQSQLSYRLPPAAGTILRVQDMNGDFLGWCVSDGPQASPAFRVLSRERKVDFDGVWWAAQVTAALARRKDLKLPHGPRRLIHGEADGLPGLSADLSDGVAVLDYTSPGLAAHADAVEAALIKPMALRGLWRRQALAGGGHGPWQRSALLPKTPARFSAGEPGLPAEADLEARDSPGMPRPLERRAWRAWARDEAAGRRVLLLGALADEAAAGRGAGPAELRLAEADIFKAVDASGAFKPQRVLAHVPALSKESFGKFDAVKLMPRLLRSLGAACEPGAKLLLACDAKPFWHAAPWEQAFKDALPGQTPALVAQLGPEADFPELAAWPQGRARRAFVFQI